MASASRLASSDPMHLSRGPPSLAQPFLSMDGLDGHASAAPPVVSNGGGPARQPLAPPRGPAHGGDEHHSAAARRGLFLHARHRDDVRARVGDPFSFGGSPAVARIPW